LITIVSLTDAGRVLGRKLQALLPDSQLLANPKPFSVTVQSRFMQGHRLVMICATGIAVRTLAPVLENKHRDPAVLVLDEQGKFVIPLLSGHEGGANQWASEVSALLESQLVMTTAQPYLNPEYCVGMGCERNCPVDELEQLYQLSLEQNNLQPEQITALTSIDIKADEVGLQELARRLELPFLTYDAASLRTVENQLSTHSDYIFKTVGVYGVAESAALFACQQQTGQAAELVMNKQKTKRATCAIARSYPAAEESGQTRASSAAADIEPPLDWII